MKYNKIALQDLPVFYINLDRHKEKSDSLEKLLVHHGFKDVHRFAGIEHTHKKMGVALSHLKILEELRDHNTPFLILEDDVRVYKMISELEVPDNADAFYLGHSYFGLYGSKGIRKVSAERFDNNLFKVYNMLAAHAIVYFNSEYIKFLTNAIKFNISIETNQDKSRANTMKFFNIYANRDPVFYQTGAHMKATKISFPNQFCVGPAEAY